jgi:GGDEF domain-containing protein
VEQAIDTGEMLALMFIDLDQFRQITDEHGFETGDLVLRAIAERLREVLRNTDTLCRVSADEFAAILPNIQDLDGTPAGRALIAGDSQTADSAGTFADGDRQHRHCLLPFTCGGTASFLRNADLALHRPKRRAQSLESVRPQSAYAVRNHAAENALIRYAQTAVQHAQHKQRTDEQKAQVFKKDGFLPSIW